MRIFSHTQYRFSVCVADLKMSLWDFFTRFTVPIFVLVLAVASVSDSDRHRKPAFRRSSGSTVPQIECKLNHRVKSLNVGLLIYGTSDVPLADQS